MSFKFIDLFCGLGGFRIAFEKLGGRCVFSSDIDKAVQNTYFMNFGEMPCGDITKINELDIPNHDILCAGFPCQPFSTAGRRLGFEDARGTLFFEVARIIKAKKPKIAFLENVQGLTNHDHGHTLEVILNILDELGYFVNYSVLNAKNFNVPQNRQRWYCVAVRKDLETVYNNFSFPKPEPLTNTLSGIIESKIDNFEDYKISEACLRNINKFIKIKNIPITPHTLAYDIRPSRCHFLNGDISNCLTAKMGTGGNNVAVIVAQQRKLTEKECLKIMGFPDDYKINKGFQAYKQIGNSVVVPLIYKIASKIVEQL